MSTLKTFGALPIVLIAVGLFWPSRWSKVAMLLGVVYGLANVLFSVRQVNATVTEGTPTVTYPGAP